MNDLTIDHIDCDKTNNSLNNLRLLTREKNTSIAHKNKINKRRFLYDLFLNDKYVGTYNRNELKQLINLRIRDYQSETMKVKKLKKKGYKWIKRV